MELELDAPRRLLVARFSQLQRALSSAPHGGGLVRTQAVVWRETSNAELGPNVDARALLAASLAEAGLGGAVGMLTARRLSTFEEVTLREGELWARCVVTVGLSNALAVGDPPGPLVAAGTINILCSLSGPLTDAALVEACTLAAEARTAALLERAFPSRRSGRPSTGTGTDCIVVTAPEIAVTVPEIAVTVPEIAVTVPEIAVAEYAGKHTLLGALIGGAVKSACAQGIGRWLDEQ